MKKLVLAATLMSLSSLCIADGVRIYNVKEYSTGQFQGSFTQLESKSYQGDPSSKAAQCSAKTHGVQGKKNDVLTIEGVHTTEIFNPWQTACRGHLRYEIKCDGASFVHESDFEIKSYFNFYDKARTSTVVQKQNTGTWPIIAKTQITGNCGVISDNDKARLRVN